MAPPGTVRKIQTVSVFIREFFEMVLLGYSRDRGKLIHEKKLEAENLVSEPL